MNVVRPAGGRKGMVTADSAKSDLKESGGEDRFFFRDDRVGGVRAAGAAQRGPDGATSESRGRLVSFFQLAVTVGILVAYLVGLAFDGIEGWRWMAYVASFAISLGPIFWLLNAEIYPLSVRSKAVGIGTMANWTFNFVVSLAFLLLIEALGRPGAFWFYGAIGVLTLVFCWKLVPETKGKRLEEIQAYFGARVKP
ncbi:MAG: MFS transporter [Solirubrobacterales bacterium]